MQKTVTTPKGTTLPLTNLKGKEYLMVGYRLQWFNETENNFIVNTDFLKLENDYAVARAHVSVYDTTGKLVKSATATKREDAKHFPDFIEKSETSAIGRALAMLGYGTQFAISELDEGDRLADSPVVNVKQEKKENSKELKVVETPVAKTSTFRKPSPKKTEEASTVGEWE